MHIFPRTDRVHDLLDQTQNPLEKFFQAKTIALIGASEAPGSVGRTLLWNLISNPFGGVVFPVNPKRPSVLGIRAYPSIGLVPQKVELAIIVTPASTVPGIIQECADAGIKHAIVISAGFKEMGEPGYKLEEQIRQILQRTGMRLIGPNCLGLMSPASGLNATFAKGMAKPGNVAFLSQSGALLTAVLDWSQKEQVGFSTCISLGSMLDVSWADLIDYFGNDPATHSILIYMETIGDASAFLSAAREVCLNKPIIVIKAGRTAAAAKAAASHTGSLTGSDEVLDAAFERVGVLRVDSISDLFHMAEVLSKQPRPKGPRLSIVTNAGGPAVLATDALIQSGGQLAGLKQSLEEKLNQFLPAAWSRNNPIDILGDAGASRYAQTLEAVATDPDSDGLLVILTPQDMTECTQTASLLQSYARLGTKPILASWMGGQIVEEGVNLLNAAGIPTFESPDTAAKAFSYMWRYSANLQSIYQTPNADEEPPLSEHERYKVQSIIEQAHRENRTLLTEIESKNLLRCYRLPVPAINLALTEQEAASMACAIGFPVVLKLHSVSISHKSDVGGVKLNLADLEQVRRGFNDIRESVGKTVGIEHFQGVSVQPMIKLEDSYELILGNSVDEQFGPVIMFGSGGQLVEVYKDYKLGLPPLNTTLARQMMEKTKVYKALQGVRGRKRVPIEKLEQLLVRFSQLVCEQKWIREIDINPLLINESNMVILDARICLFEKGAHPNRLSNSCIRPYPTQYISHAKIKDGVVITVRPIKPEDEPLVSTFHKTLGERSIHLRFYSSIELRERIAHERLLRICCCDYNREVGLVATHPQDGSILAIGSIKRLSNISHAKFTLLVSDLWQNKGIGTYLLNRLLDIARQEGILMVKAELLQENLQMQQICHKLGFEIKKPEGGAHFLATKHLVGE